jgi:penicillin-binding protein 1A
MPKIILDYLRFFIDINKRIIKKLIIVLGCVSLLGVLFLITILIFIGYYLYYDKSNLPIIDKFYNYTPPTIGTIYDNDGKILAELAKEYRRIIKFDEIPKPVIYAILAAEDKNFFKHNGVDWKAFSRSIWKNLVHSIKAADEVYNQKRDIKISKVIVFQQGASTLTQQLVEEVFSEELFNREENQKNWIYKSSEWLFGSNKTKLLRIKLEKMRLAIWLENKLLERYGSKYEVKKEILSKFASTVYIGSGRYGFDSAAEFYFGKPINKFTSEDIDKAALLAGVIKFPIPSNIKTAQNYINRRNEVLKLMKLNGFISLKEFEKFQLTKTEFVERKDNEFSSPSVIKRVFSEIKNLGLSTNHIFEGGIKVNTTVSTKVQIIANEALERGLLEYEKRHPQYKGKIQGAVVVLANDGRILALVGGRKFYNNKLHRYSDLDRVTRKRQVGSAFKPFIYLTAFMQGYKLTDVISDSPFPIPLGYKRGVHWVNNYDRKNLGFVSVCEALYRSRNTPTIRITLALGEGSFEKSGMKKIIDTARLMGIKSEFHHDTDHLGRTIYYPTSALGASEMSLMELTNAYREIASDISVEPYLIQKIVDRNNNVIFTKVDSKKKSAINFEALEKVRFCLRKVVTQPGGTAYSLSLAKFPIQVFGKTGTSDDFRNALFIGSTYGPKGITVGVAINFDDNSSLGNSETGAKTALPVFKEIMEKIYDQNIFGPPPLFQSSIKENDRL